MRLPIIIIATTICLTTGAEARHHRHTQMSLYGMSRGVHVHHTAPVVHATAPGLQVWRRHHRRHYAAIHADPIPTQRHEQPAERENDETTTAQKPAEYKLAKVRAVAPLVFDHSLLFDPAPRLPVDHFSKAAPWAGTLSY
jgi:hypothetical protein